MGYLSRHSPGNDKRQFKMYDCRKAPQRVRDRLFGIYLKEFERARRDLAFAA